MKQNKCHRLCSRPKHFAVFFSRHTCSWDLMLPLCLGVDYYLLQLIRCGSWTAQTVQCLRNFLSTREPSPQQCCHLGSSLRSHMHTFSWVFRLPLTCPASCVCVCVFIIPTYYFILLFSSFLLILSFQWIQLVLFAALAIKQFLPQHSNEPLSLFHWDCCYVWKLEGRAGGRRRMLICRESLFCGGKAAEEEPRGCHLMCLRYIKNWWKMLKAAPAPPSLVSAHAEIQDLTGRCFVGPGQSLVWNGSSPSLSTWEEGFSLKVCLDAGGCCCTCAWLHSFSPLYSPVMEMFVHCGHHWAKAGGGRDWAEHPCNLTHRMSENVTQSQELSSRSAGATLIMYIEIIAKRSGFLLGICVSSSLSGVWNVIS